MPLTIQTIVVPVGAANIVSAASLRTVISGAGITVPAGRTPVGFTLPSISDDQTGLNFNMRNGNTQYIFDTGTLILTLRQQIFLLNSLGHCARSYWLRHEMHHVRDNVNIMNRIDSVLRADPQFASMLVNPTVWRAVAAGSPFSIVRQRIGVVFSRMTSNAVSNVDTAAEYARVERTIRARCGGAIDRILKKGMQGHGIDRVQVELNAHPPTALPLLVPDGIFGTKTKTRVEEFQSNQTPPLVDDGIVGPLTRAALGL